MKRMKWLVATLCAVALVAAACGDDDSDDSSDSSAAETAAAQAAAEASAAEAATAQQAAEDAETARAEAEQRLADAEAAAAEASAEQQAAAQAELEAAMAAANEAEQAAAAAMAEAEAAAARESEAQQALAAADEVAVDFGVDAEEKVIRVGLNTDLTGAFAPLTTAITDAHEAYWEWVNDNGGIEGWTVEPIVVDNAYDVATHLENYEVMSGTGSDGVVMLATSTGSPHSAAIAQRLIEDQMAAIPLSWYSGWPDPEIGQNLFEVQTNYCIEAMNGSTYMSETYGPDVAIVSFPGDYGQDGARGVKVAAEALGLNIVYDGEGAVIPGSDQTPVINEIVNSGADWVWATLNPGHLAELMGGAFSAGFRGQWMGNSPTWNPALLNTAIGPIADQFYTHSTYTVLWGVGEAEGMRETIEVLREYREDAPFNDVYIISFIQGYMVHQILERAILTGDLTRAGVLAAANSVTANLKGLAPEQSWRGDPNANLVRETYIYDVDLSLYTPRATVSTEDGNGGYRLIKGPYVSETAANWEYEPCFIAS